MRRAVAQGGVAAVEVEVGVKVVSDFHAGFFETGKGPALGQQFGFERTPAGFGLRVVVGVARPAEAGQPARLGDAGAAGGAGVLAALPGTTPVGVDKEARCGLPQGQRLFEGQEHGFGGHLRGQVPVHDPAGAGVAPRG